MNLLSSLLKYTADQIAALRAKNVSQDTVVGGLDTRLSTAEGSINTLSSRIETAISGVTTDTEVTDIRVGDDGVTYSTAGKSVRTQFSGVKKDLNGKTAETAFYSVEQGSGAAAVCKCSTLKIEAGEILRSISYYENSYTTSKVFFVVNASGKILDKYTHSAAQNGWESVSINKSYDEDAYIAMYVNGMRLSYVSSVPSTPYFSQGLYQTASYTDISKEIGDTLTFTQNVPDRYYSLVAKAIVQKVGATENIEKLYGIADSQEESIKNLNAQLFTHRETLSDLKGKITNNVVYSASGVLETNNAVATTDKFVCDNSEDVVAEYTISWAATWDENGAFIARRTPGTKRYTPTASEKYIALSFPNSLGFDNLSNQSVSGAYSVADGELIQRISELESASGIAANTVTIKSDGSGDYISLRECFEDITPSKFNAYIVEIYEGTYDVKADFTAEEWAVESQSFWGLFVPDYVTLRGIGNRENIIITASDANARSYVSTLNLRGTASIENVTVYGNHMRYVIHDDFDASDRSVGAKRRIKDCILHGENLTVNAVYGSACRDGADWQFENVVFKCSDSTIGFRNHNNTGWTNAAKLRFVNCRMTRMALSTMSNNANGILTYVSLYGNKISIVLDLNEENPTAYGRGCLYKVSGFANDIALTRITVTDGGDYSGNIDLI